MTETRHNHHRHEDPQRHSVHHGHDPYWKRAHRDWHFWGGLLMMFAAITIYVMSEDLSWRPGSQSQPPLSGAVAK